MKLTASVFGAALPAEGKARKASAAPIPTSDAFSAVTFREKAASNVDDAVSYAQSHGLADGRIQAELTAAGVKQAEGYNPAEFQQERAEEQAKETPAFAPQTPDLDEPFPPMLLTGSLRPLASAMVAGSTVYDIRSLQAMKVVASNMVGDDMLILQAKTASGIERRVISKAAGLSVVPASLFGVVAALKQAGKTYFGEMINGAIIDAGLPVDPDVNWDKVLMGTYRRFRWTRNMDLLEDAIHDMLTKLLVGLGEAHNSSGTPLLGKFKPNAADANLPKAKQVTNFLMTYLLPWQNRMSNGSASVRRYIQKFEGGMFTPDSQLGTEDSVGVIDQQPSTDSVPAIESVGEDRLLSEFASYVNSKYKGATGQHILLLLNLYAENPPDRTKENAQANISAWEQATGTGRENYYKTHGKLVNALKEFAATNSGPGSALVQEIVNTLKPAPTPATKAPAKGKEEPVSVTSSDITPDNIVMPEIDQEEAAMRPAHRDHAAKARKASVSLFAALKRLANEEPDEILMALGEIRDHYAGELDKVDALIENLGGGEGEAKEAAYTPIRTADLTGDDHAVTELRLYIENDSDLYRRQMLPIIKNVMRKKKRGVYDPALAPKLWMYLVNEGAKKYTKEFGTPGDKVNVIFSKQVREALAKEMAEDYSTQIDNGEYDGIDAKEASAPCPTRKTDRFAALKRVAEEAPAEVAEALQELFSGTDTTKEFIEVLAENLDIPLEEGDDKDFGGDDEDGDSASVTAAGSKVTFPIKTDAGKPDKRYKVTETMGGKEKPVFELSFSGKYQSTHDTKAEAESAAKTLRTKHTKDMRIEDKEAPKEAPKEASYYVLKATDASGKVAGYFNGNDFTSKVNSAGKQFADVDTAKMAAKAVKAPEGHKLSLARVQKEAMPAIPPVGNNKIEDYLRAGRAGRAGNLATDGSTVTLHGNEIFKLENGKAYGSWAGWVTPTTARNVTGLARCFGLNAGFYIKGGNPCCKSYETDGPVQDTRAWIELGPVNEGLGKTTQASAEKVAVDLNSLDAFTRQYLETALWAETDELDPNGGDPLDNIFGIDDIDDASVQEAIKECAEFQEKAAEILSRYDESTAGHDFWLTRNGHGAGFWDGDYTAQEDDGDKLTEIAKSMGERSIYVVVYNTDQITDPADGSIQVPVGSEEGAEDGDVVRDKIQSGEYTAKLFITFG